MNPDGYEILSELLRNGLSVGYRARQRATGRDVTLQFLPAADLSVAATAERDRQWRRVEVLALLDHPHILAISEIGRYDNGSFLVRPLVSGTTLNHHLREHGPIPPHQAARWCLQLASAVEHAHGLGIVGCDLASSHLLFDGGEVLVHSFDTARVRSLHPPVPADDPPGMLVGIPITMTPEMVTGRAKLDDARRDVWSLGCLLFELLTGDVPFRGAVFTDTLYLIASQEVPRPSGMRPEIEPALERVCLGCLQKDPDKRYPNMTTVIDALESYLEGRPEQGSSEPTLAQRMGKWVRGWWSGTPA